MSLAGVQYPVSNWSAQPSLTIPMESAGETWSTCVTDRGSEGNPASSPEKRSASGVIADKNPRSPMRALNIQIQTNREPSLNVDRLRRILDDLSNLKPLVESAIRDEGGEHGLFMNYTYLTADLPAFWVAVQERLLSIPDFGDKVRNCSTIIASRGEDGWENYLLLHHFDPFIETQTLN